MSDRGFSAAMITALQQPRVQIARLASAHFDSGTLYLTDAPFDIVYDGNTYERTAGLLDFGDIQETGELLVNEQRLTLSGVDTSIAIAKINADDYLDRELRVYLCVVNDDGSIVVDPELIFSGRMTGQQIDENTEAGTCTVQTTAAPAWADFGRAPGRHTNNEEQQFYFAGDEGFDHVSQIPKSFVWGRA